MVNETGRKAIGCPAGIFHWPFDSRSDLSHLNLHDKPPKTLEPYRRELEGWLARRLYECFRPPASAG